MNAEQELAVIKKLEEERKRSDTCYAPMITKIILFAFLGTVSTVSIAFLTTKLWTILLK